MLPYPRVPPVLIIVEAPQASAGCRILYTLLFLTYFEVEIFYMPFAMASESPSLVNKWTKF